MNIGAHQLAEGVVQLGYKEVVLKCDGELLSKAVQS